MIEVNIRVRSRWMADFSLYDFCWAFIQLVFFLGWVAFFDSSFFTLSCTSCSVLRASSTCPSLPFAAHIWNRWTADYPLYHSSCVFLFHPRLPSFYLFYSLACLGLLDSPPVLLIIVLLFAIVNVVGFNARTVSRDARLNSRERYRFDDALPCVLCLHMRVDTLI